MNKKMLGACLLALTPLWAHAATFDKFVPADSKIGFTYEQMGVSLDGEFKKFDGTLSFDPANAETAKVTLSVPLADIDTGSAEGNDEVANAEWFNTGAHPAASFESTAIRVEGDGYQVDGLLTIKGISKPISFPATFVEKGATGTFEGSFVIQRGDFNVGEGAWSTFDIVANDVNVNFSIVAAQ